MLSLGSVIRAQLILQALRVLQQLLLVFLIVRLWGELYFSDWVVLMTAAGFFALADFGIQTVLSNTCLALSRAEDREQLSAFVRRFLGYYLAFIPVLALIGSLLVGMFGIEWLVNTNVMVGAQGAGVLAALSLAALFGIPLTVLGSVYAARGDVAKGINRVSLQIMGQTILIVISMLITKNPVVTALTYPLSTAMCLLAVLWDISRRYPDISLKPDISGGVQCFAMIRIGIFYFINPFATYAVQALPVFYFSSLAHSGSIVAIFAATRTLVGLLRQLTTQIANAVGVEIFRKFVVGEMAKSAELYGDANRFLAALCGLLAGYVLAVATPFLALWTQNKLIADPVMTLILVSTICLAAPAFLALALLQISNKPKILTVAALLQAGLSCFCIVLATFMQGDVAILAMLGLVEGAVNLFIIYHAQKRFAFIRTHHAMQFYGYCALAILLSYLPAMLVFQLLPHDSLTMFIVSCGVAGLPVLPLLFFLGLTTDARAQVKRRIGI